MPYTGYSDQMPPRDARRLVRGWQSTGRSAVHSAYTRGGQVVCIEDSGGGVIVRLGARSRRDFDAVVSEFGGAVHKA
jgi:hypothetical protein